MTEALWLHEWNISNLAESQHNLARLEAQLSEEVQRQHQILEQLEHRLGVEPAVGGRAQAAEDIQQRVDAIKQQHGVGSDPGSSAGSSSAREEMSKPWEPPKKGELPAEWLAHFTPEELAASAKEAEHWLQGTKNALKHVWRGYRDRCWGKDEMKPVSGVEGRKWAGIGLQILDALSTIWVFGFTEEFDEATKFVESLRFDQAGLVSFFELTIRGLGGLLSAHSLSGREVFLRKAKELADRMMPAFASDLPGFPTTQINLKTGQGQKGWYSGTVLAEAGTVQLEFRYLSQHTGDPRYGEKADQAMRSILAAANGQGIVPWGISRFGNPPRFINRHITFGAMGDSYYEYLLKMYLQTSQSEPEWKEAWKRAMKELQARLIKKTQGGLTYVSEEVNGRTQHKMDHLACFVGGMLVYGARQLAKEDVDPAWVESAAGITETCYQMYHRQPSHLSPEASKFFADRHSGDMEVFNNAAHYLLRPEAAEAIFYMFYYTGDPKYRRMAGEIFDAIETHCRTNYGYSAVKDVRQGNPQMKDEMETFFIAETLKYLFLTFVPNPRDVINLDEFVFTTEAHPLRIFKPQKGAAGAGSPPQGGFKDLRTLLRGGGQ